MGSVVSICQAKNSDVLVAPPIVPSQEVAQAAVHQDTGKNNSLDKSVGKEAEQLKRTETQSLSKGLEHKSDVESVVSAEKKSTRTQRKSVGSEHRLKRTGNFPEKEITINLKIFGKFHRVSFLIFF